MRIAVDFDGTIVEHMYPKIGKVMPFAFEALKELQASGHEIILWTFRSGDELTEAVEFCKKHGLEFFAINKSHPDEVYNHSMSRKIYADVYIDDRNIGGFLGWSNIWKILNNNESSNNKDFFENFEKKKNIFTEKIKKLFI